MYKNTPFHDAVVLIIYFMYSQTYTQPAKYVTKGKRSILGQDSIKWGSLTGPVFMMS